MKADTSHIESCRNTWHRHMQYCTDCFQSFYASKAGMCEFGKVVYGEYASAIEAHRDCECLTATEAKPCK